MGCLLNRRVGGRPPLYLLRRVTRGSGVSVCQLYLRRTATYRGSSEAVRDGVRSSLPPHQGVLTL